MELSSTPTWRPSPSACVKYCVSCSHKKHGYYGTRIYWCWRALKQRCNVKNSRHYNHYGGRGITYCAKWEEFAGFWEDMQSGYAEHLTLDRIDVNGNYSKENCRWVDNETQQANKRNNILIFYKGKTQHLAAWIRELNLNNGSVRSRINAGETPLSVITYNYKKYKK